MTKCSIVWLSMLLQVYLCSPIQISEMREVDRAQCAKSVYPRGVSRVVKSFHLAYNLPFVLKHLRHEV